MRLRAEHAAALPLHSDQPVTRMGRAVGWPDENYFARRFKAHYGLSATYRARFATGAIHLGARPGGLHHPGGRGRIMPLWPPKSRPASTRCGRPAPTGPRPTTTGGPR